MLFCQLYRILKREREIWDWSFNWDVIEDEMRQIEELEELEDRLHETGWVPRILAGGKGGDAHLNWLERLPVGTIFIAVGAGDSVASKYELIWKGNTFCLLYRYYGDETETFNEDYVYTTNFARFKPVYEILSLGGEASDNLPKEGEENVPQQCDRPD